MFQTKQEMKDELAELDARITKAMGHINSTKFDSDGASREEARCLMRQAGYMMDYANVLIQRINAA